MKKFTLFIISFFSFTSCTLFNSDNEINVEYFFFEHDNYLRVYAIVQDIEIERFGSKDSLIESSLEIRSSNKFIVQDDFDTTYFFRYADKVSFVQIKTINVGEYRIDSTEKFSYGFVTNKGYNYNIRTNLSNVIKRSNDVTLYLIPGVKAIPGVGAEFKMFALRLKMIEEYLPSSEELYVEIYNSKGVILHKSSSGISHTTALEDVKPIDVGDHYIYSYDWFLDEMMMPKNNTYGAVLIIPAKKEPYTKRIEFNWDNNGL